MKRRRSCSNGTYDALTAHPQNRTLTPYPLSNHAANRQPSPPVSLHFPSAFTSRHPSRRPSPARHPSQPHTLRLVDEESPDLLFLSEHKLSTEKLPAVAPSLQALLPGYEPHWAISTAKKGYSGVVALVKAGTNVLGVAIDTLCRQSSHRVHVHAPQLFFRPFSRPWFAHFPAHVSPISPAPLFRPFLPPLSPAHFSRPFLPPISPACITAILFVCIRSSLNEGRTLTLELDSCFVVGAYVPNSGQDLGRLKYRIDTWEPAMRDHLLALEAQGKPVLLIGDLNVAHLDADIWNVTAKHIAKSAGTTPQERAAFGTLLEGGERAAGGEGGEGSEGGGEVRFVDCFRHLYPEATGCFSYWSTRAGNQHTNRGLRLDYAVVSKSVTSASNELELHDCQHLPEFAPNGDHCPTMVSLRLKA